MIEDIFAAGFLVAAIIAALTIFLSFRHVRRVNQSKADREFAIRMVREDRVHELSPYQRGLAQSYYLDQFTATGNESDKENLLKLEG